MASRNISQNRLMLGKKFGDHYLTKREVDVLKYVVMGYTSKQIAQSLNISFRTIETYIETLKMKLNCGSKGHIAKVVIETQLIFQLGIV